MKSDRRLTRRQALKFAAGVAAAPLFLPDRLFGDEAPSKLIVMAIPPAEHRQIETTRGMSATYQRETTAQGRLRLCCRSRPLLSCSDWVHPAPE